MLYAWIVRRRVRAGFRALSEARPEATLRQFAPGVLFCFAGEHALGGERRGITEVRAWFARLYEVFPGIMFEVGQVLVAGGPWDTRVATRFTVSAPRPDGSRYANEGVQLLRLRWGRVVEDRLYEDTQLLANELAVRGVRQDALRGSG
jgi:ketosteroid isomerase-like protein